MSRGDDVRAIVLGYDRATKIYFGGPPFSSEVDRELATAEQVKRNGLPARNRIVIGECALDGEKVVGYASTTVMSNAKPIAYPEVLPMHLDKSHGTLDYVQLKKILVDPAYFGTGVAEALLKNSFSIAGGLGKDWVVDVNARNSRMLHFLDKHGVTISFAWRSRAGSLMYRLEREA
jgi:GNAT superfamily N-acetyltransferase